MVVPTAIKIVNDMLSISGNEVTIDYHLKCLMIATVECTMRKGYMAGYKDCNDKKPSQVTKKQMNELSEILYNALHKK